MLKIRSLIQFSNSFHTKNSYYGFHSQSGKSGNAKIAFVAARVEKTTCFCFNYKYNFNYNLKFSITITITIIQVQVIVIQLQFQIQLQ